MFSSSLAPVPTPLPIPSPKLSPSPHSAQPQPSQACYVRLAFISHLLFADGPTPTACRVFSPLITPRMASSSSSSFVDLIELPDSPTAEVQQTFQLPELPPPELPLPELPLPEKQQQPTAGPSSPPSADVPPPPASPDALQENRLDSDPDPNPDPQQLHETPTEQSPPQPQTFSPNKRKNPYAVQLNQLPNDLQKFLNSVKRYFTAKVNLQRQRAALSDTTYAKAQERMLCYLGYVRSVLDSNLPVTADCFLRLPLIEGYIDFLKDERQLSAATLANHVSALLYPVKFVHQEHAPEYKDVLIIRQLRSQSTILQKEGDLERPRTKEDLEAENRWLPWDEVVLAVASQRQRFESTRPLRTKAKECSDLVLLSLYVYIPPSRGLEIRTLEVTSDASCLEPKNSSGRNLLLLRDDKWVVLHFNNYKTRRFRGRDELELQPEDELCRLLVMYIRDYRPQLVSEMSQHFLLLNKNGAPFSSAAFSAHLKSVLYGLTGKLASVNVLRSSFITWAYGKSDCTDAMKSSLAASLRHSREQAQRTYDRRTANERKGLAVSLARDYAQGRLDGNSVEEEEEEVGGGEGGAPRPAQSASGGVKVKPGDFVGLVEEGSTFSNPKILVGQVKSFVGQREVSLLWYKRFKTMYRLTLDGEEWTESLDSLVPISMEASRKQGGLYKLLTSPRSIHRAINP